MKNFLFILLTLIGYHSMSSQDYMAISNYFLKSSTPENVAKVKNKIQQAGYEAQAIEFIKLKKRYAYLKSKKSAQEIKEEFDRNYPKPSKTYNYKQITYYKNKLKSTSKRINQLKISMSLAKTSANLCRNNAYRQGRCSNEIRNYNRQVDLYNSAVSNYKQYRQKGNRYVMKHKAYKDEYNDAVSRYNQKIKRAYDYEKEKSKVYANKAGLEFMLKECINKAN